MDGRFPQLAALAANRHGVFTTDMARSVGVSDRLRFEWLVQGFIERLGKRTFRFAGTPQTWHYELAMGLGEYGADAAVAGRSAAGLQHLDGFDRNAVELWVPRACRNRCAGTRARTSSQPLLPGDVVTVDGLRCVTAERLILDSLLFKFSRAEIHNAIDSAIRLRLVSETRLRQRVAANLVTNVKHRRVLTTALVGAGGESSLERRFLAIVRQAGLSRPKLQRRYHAGTRTVARVDAEFADGLVIEVSGHATHASRVHRQRDAQRHTELTLLGKRVITFTYDDVYGRPEWVLTILRAAGVTTAA